MNIGMILDKPFPPDPRVENEAKQLISNGHDVYLFCLNFSKQSKYENINGIYVYRYNFSKFLYNKLSPLAFTLPFYHWLLKKKIYQFIKDCNLDVIHIHDMVAAKPIFKLESSLPIILDLHENRPEIMKSYTHITKGIGRILINLEKWKKYEYKYIRKADKTIVVTKEAKQHYINEIPELNPQNIIYAPNTIDIDIFLKYKIRSEIINKYKNYFTILYLGAIGIRRGLDIAIKSISILKYKINNIKFVIVGSGRDRKYLENLVSEYNLKNEVEFTGYQDLSLFPSYIKASDVGICPLKRNKHHDTTYANKIFQYMSLGLPILVSDCPAQANVVKKYQCGLIHKAGNSEDIATKVLKFYNNPDLREQMGKNGRKAVLEKYNWEETGKNLVNLYKNLPYSTK